MSLHQGRQASISPAQKAWKTTVTLALGTALMSLGSTLLSGSVQAEPVSHSDSAHSDSFRIAAQSDTVSQMEMQVWQQINAQRQSYGLPSLIMNRQLSQVARNHSQQMAQYNFYSHINLQGQTHRQRVEAAGMRAYVIGENIMQVVQSKDPARVSVYSWMNSPGHRRNVLLPEMKETGVGIWRQGNRYFVTQIYMEPK